MNTIFKKIIVSILTWQARLVLKKYKPKIVAITGSVGKTSTKDAIYTVLSSTFKTRKSEKSWNSDVSIPLTILGCPNGLANPLVWIANFLKGFLLIILREEYPQWLVLEVGADKPGDIESVARWIRPDVAVLTRLGEVPAHVEFFPSIEELVREKGLLAVALKSDGVFVFNHDDKKIRDFAELIVHKKLSFGFNSGSAVLGSGESFLYGTYEDSPIEFPVGISFRVHVRGESLPINLLGTLGRHHMYPLLAAYAVGVSQNIDILKIQTALSTHVSPKGRMKLLPGIKNTVIIDDSYNSSPTAVHEALQALKLVTTRGRKIAILGDMLELGQYSTDEHKRVGVMVTKSADILVTVGIRSRATAEAALDAGLNESHVFQFDKSEGAGNFLQNIIREGDIILIKGSQAMRMERVVEELMRHPEDKGTLLVRQEKEWINR